MPEPKEIAEIKRSLKKYREAEEVLLSLAKNQFVPSLCPLHPHHHMLSMELFGVGCWKWTCRFCGQEDS